MIPRFVPAIILFLSFNLFFVSCDAPSAEATKEEAVEFVNEEGVLQLNNGEKWTANKETTEGVQKMKAQIHAFNELGLGEDSLNFAQLSTGLSNTMKGIFDQCSMTGPAHDELHDFLVPLLGYIKKISPENVALSNESILNTEQRLEEYDTYFQ